MQEQIYGDMFCRDLFPLRGARLCMAAPSLLQNILLIGGRLVCPIRPSNVQHQQPRFRSRHYDVQGDGPTGLLQDVWLYYVLPKL